MRNNEKKPALMVAAELGDVPISIKKHHIVSSLFLLALLASCNMQGHKLFADGDSDDENNTTSQGHHQEPAAKTLNTSWSAMSTAVLMAGGTEQEAMRFDKEFNTKRSESNTEAFSAAYASQRVKGTSEEEAITFAKEEASAPRGIYYYMVLAMHPEAVALRLSNVYKAQRGEGNSEAWASAYARKVVLEEKTDEEAQAYAEELETSFTMMERFSTVAQPGDMEEQGLKTMLYKLMLRVNEPLTVAKTYADNVQKQQKLGKSQAWAMAYANMIARGENDTYARTYAQHFKAKIREGKSNGWVRAYANMRAQGDDDVYARTYAQHYEEQLAAGKSHDWASAYTSKRVNGHDDTFARTYADHKEEQLAAGKSHDWASAYATQRANGKKGAFARTYADIFEAQLKAGKSQDWASAYAIMRAQGKSHQEAEVYADRQHPE